MICSVGNRGREEAEILNFLLALIHYHFQFTYCLCKGRMARVAALISWFCLLRWVLSGKCAQTGLSPGHSPCVWEISYTALYKRPQTRFPSRGAEVAVDYSSSRQICDTCSMDELALCWRTGASVVQFSGNTCWCQLSCLEQTTRRGEEHCTCSALLFPGILSPKMTCHLAGSCIAQGL